MADIRKRTNLKGETSYQVRYANIATKTGHAYKSFPTMKQARAFREDSRQRASQPYKISHDIHTVSDAVDKWLEICAKEGLDDKEPVTLATWKGYTYLADKMKAYDWDKPLHALEAPDIIDFRSWLTTTYSRDIARRTLGGLHAALKEMTLRGIIPSNVAAGVSIRKKSRYDKPVTIPKPTEIMELLAAADRLANSPIKSVADAWVRYRPMLYLAADSGMRPQEYLAVAQEHFTQEGVRVERAIERGGYKLSVPKTAAGRRFIELSPETISMVQHYIKYHAVDNVHDLVFPTSSGHWQSIDNWRKRGFHAACKEAGLMQEVVTDEGAALKPKYRPYDLRHFFASMQIAQKKNLKKIQRLMGHASIETTLDVYGHLIEEMEDSEKRQSGMLATMAQNSCGATVAEHH